MTFGVVWSVLRTRLRQDGCMIGSSLAFALLCMWFRWIVGADGGVAVLVGLEYDMGLHWVSRGSVRVGICSCNGDVSVHVGVGVGVVVIGVLNVM